ncbi:MAG TPA: potassium-transporting ATPase subunit KdpC [Hyphomonadaceae bacterium]|jgi:K+-transporting ATPase ATPase C chain|nr:potassium-transporting ATPase subunit KdpC [Hyphomonadaceae bacterium]
MSHIRPALVLLILFTLLLGIVYPLAMTGIGQGLFKHQANGSPLTRNGAVVGSSLIGQSFTKPGYFWGRPSAAGKGYDGRSSAGSNLGPSSQALADRIKAEAERVGKPAGEIPPDLLTASGSGLDPHISPAAARFQTARVASARGLPEDIVERLVDEHVEAPSLGFIGEPRVNVLALNLALDDLHPPAPQ